MEGVLRVKLAARCCLLGWGAPPVHRSLRKHLRAGRGTYLLPALLGLVSGAGEAKNGEAHLME